MRLLRDHRVTSRMTVMDHALSYSVASLSLVDVEGEEVAVAADGPELIADRRRFAFDDSLPARAAFEPHHGLVQREPGWSEVVGEDGKAVIPQRRDLLNDSPLDTWRGGLCDVKVAEEVRETVAKEGVEDVLLPPQPLPVQSSTGTVYDRTLLMDRS
jgi:hypothetical protein